MSYEYTALDPAANDRVKALAKVDAGNADEWSRIVSNLATIPPIVTSASWQA